MKRLPEAMGLLTKKPVGVLPRSHVPVLFSGIFRRLPDIPATFFSMLEWVGQS